MLRAIGFAMSLMVAAAGLHAQTGKWEIPPTAKAEKSPLKATPDVLKKGRGLFMARCRKCHGPAGKGNGAEADPNHKPADLTASKAEENPDGVLFHKIGNGQPPIMPAFKGTMSRDEIWTVIEYVKSLRTAE
jgi:mono/diheme cytochrome c family protein